MNVKNLTAKIKSADTVEGLAEGQIIAYASVFDNVDSYGDIVRKGAFEATLKEWADSGAPIPLLFGHRLDDPDYNIGAVIKAEEDDRGLKIVAQLDVDAPKAAQVYRLVKGGRIRELSFAFDVLDYTVADGIRELTELKLYECSIVPIGANPETEIVAVKAAVEAFRAGMLDSKAGREIAQANELKLREVSDSMKSGASLIDDLLSSINPGAKSAPDTQEPSNGDPTPEAEPAGKSGFNPSDLLVAEIEFLTRGLD